MNKVVTIDFDIIMSPSIFLYNDYVPRSTWDFLLNNPYDPNMHLLRINANYYQRLFNFVMECTKVLPANKIHFCEDHGQTVNFITEKSDVVNIDFHHDLGYPNGEDHINIEECPTCANWVYYLNDKNLLNSYVWIHDIDRWDDPLEENQIDYLDYNLEEFDLATLFPIDELVIVLSEPWVPPYIQPLYFTLMDYCQSYYFKNFDYIQGTYLDTH